MTEGFDAGLLPRGGLLLCAVSGGADSVCLLRLALEAAPGLDMRVACAHFNHCLRGAESERDEAFVRGLCERLGVPAKFGRGDVAAFAREKGLGTEEAARRLRYEFLEREAEALGADAIATAHTADDNAETMLLNLARGAGLRGLCGIPERRGRVIRPMLGMTRAEVEARLAAWGEAHVEDSSNAADDYARNRLRHRAVPALESVNPEFIRAAARASALLRRDEDFLEGLARDFVEKHPEGLPCRELLELPVPVSSRALRLASGASLSEAHVAAALVLARGEGQGSLDLPGVRLRRELGRLSFGSGGAFELPERPLVLGGETPLPEAGLTLRSEYTVYSNEIHSSLNTFFFQCENICGTITCTPKRDGDRIRLRGRGCTKKLSDLFSERRLSRAERGLVPVLRDEAGPIAVCGFGAAERVWPAPGERALRVDVIKTNITGRGSEK